MTIDNKSYINGKFFVHADHDHKATRFGVRVDEASKSVEFALTVPWEAPPHDPDANHHPVLEAIRDLIEEFDRYTTNPKLKES